MIIHASVPKSNQNIDLYNVSWEHNFVQSYLVQGNWDFQLPDVSIVIRLSLVWQLAKKRITVQASCVSFTLWKTPQQKSPKPKLWHIKSYFDL